MVSDIAFPGDPRLLVPDQGAVFIFCSKAGRKQWVTVRCPIAMGLLRRLSRGRRPSDYLFPDLRTSMLSRFRQAQVGIGLKKAPFVIHSLRHGGASYDYIRGLPITRIILRGRWGGLKVSRQYIQESQALVLELHIPRRARRAVKLYAHSDEVVKFYLDL
jgi:integrase